MAPKGFAYTTEFYTALGMFHAVWGQIELTIDCAIWKAMGTETEQEAHKRVASMKFGKKLKKLRTLIDNGKFKHSQKVKDLLRRIEDESRRNVFAHSILASDKRSVTFIHRSVRRGEYKVERHTIAGHGFIKHAQLFVHIAADLMRAVELSDKEVRDFAAALIPG
jgi:hypothetical protein